MYTHGSQINEKLKINNEGINNINVGADASVCPEHKRNTQKGITLLALIITIIVLLILAIVSVKLISKGGVIDRAKQGTINYKLKEIHENVKLSYTSLKLGNNLNIITMSEKIKELQKNKYKDYIEKVSYTSTKVFYKITDKLDGKEYMIDMQTGEIGIYRDKLEKIEADDTLWYYEGTRITGYKGTILKDVTVPNVIKKKDGTEVKVTNVALSNVNFEGTLTFSSGLTINAETTCSTVENIVIGDNVTINSGAFKNCSNTKNVKIGRNLRALGEIFQNNNIETATIEAISEAGLSALSKFGPALRGYIVINEGITEITNTVFNGCSNITGVIIPDTIQDIRPGTFGGCTSLKMVRLPEKMQSIGWRSIYELQ